MLTSSETSGNKFGEVKGLSRLSLDVGPSHQEVYLPG